MLNEREAVAIESLFLAESHQASNPELIKKTQWPKSDEAPSEKETFLVDSNRRVLLEDFVSTRKL